jgi:nucleoid DNA-binding protein
MKPIKFKSVAGETAERLSRPVEEVEAVLQMYFKELRLALTGLAHPRVQVFNLGTFQLREKRTEKKRDGKKMLLAQHEQLITNLPLQQDLLKDIERMEQVLSMMQSEKERKQTIRQSRGVDHE